VTSSPPPGPRRQREHRLSVTPPRQHVTLSAVHHAHLAARLTPRDRWLLEMLHEHRVLTTDTITRMAFPSGRAARLRLLRLYQWDVLDRFQPRLRTGAAPMHYVLGCAGAAVLAALSGLPLAALGYRREDVLALAHHHTLAHTVAINDLFAQLVAHTTSVLDHPANAVPSHEQVLLVEWWSQWRCLGRVGDLVRPDAYGRITTPAANPSARSVEFEWFLEFDFGTSTLATLAEKVTRYARLAAATGAPTPVLVWLPGPRREAGAREALTRALYRLDQPDLVPVATTAPLDDHGPRNYTAPAHRAREPVLGDDGSHILRAAPGSWFDPAGHIWLPVPVSGHSIAPAIRARSGRTTPGAGGRMSLVDLAALWPAGQRRHPALTDTSTRVLADPRPRHRDRTDSRSASRRELERVELVAPDPIPPAPHTYSPNIPSPPTRRR